MKNAMIFVFLIIFVGMLLAIQRAVGAVPAALSGVEFRFDLKFGLVTMVMMLFWLFL